MKKIYIIAGLLFLASCGQAEVEQATITDVPATPKTVIEEVITEEEEDDEEIETPAEEINDEVAALETATEDLSKTVTVDAEYTNPKGIVDMKLDYTLDSDGIISAINISATTYDGLGDFDTSIQKLIGSTLEEAAEFSSSSSLTNAAFKSAVKSQL